MERRDFVKLGLASVGLGGIAPSALAQQPCRTMAGSIYYTEAAPGRWAEKAASHVPSIGIEKKDGKVAVRVVNAHEMKGFGHYIVKHVLLDKEYKFLDEHLFNPDNDKAAISTFTLENYTGDLYVLSMCNKHDVWLNSVKV